MKHLIATCLLLAATVSAGGCITEEESADPPEGCGLLSPIDCGTESESPPAQDDDAPGEGLFGIFFPHGDKER